jgi:hypothetical protein
MKGSLYRSGIQVQHIFNSNARVLFTSLGLPSPIALTTIHGVMKWLHPEAPTTPLVSAFERTVTLVPGEPGCGFEYQIQSDMLALRPIESETAATSVLFSPATDPAYLQRFVTPGGVVGSPEIVAALVASGAAKSEDELQRACNVVNSADRALLEQVWSLAQGDTGHAVLITYACAVHGVAPADAAARLAGANWRM